MISIFSQVTNKNDVDFIYDCSINEEDQVCFTHIIKQENNMDVIAGLIMDFPTIRDLMNCQKLIEQDFKDFTIKDNPDYYRIYSKKNTDKILLPKKFLTESYKILKNMWTDEEEIKNEN